MRHVFFFLAASPRERSQKNMRCICISASASPTPSYHVAAGVVAAAALGGWHPVLHLNSRFACEAEASQNIHAKHMHEQPLAMSVAKSLAKSCQLFSSQRLRRSTCAPHWGAYPCVFTIYIYIYIICVCACICLNPGILVYPSI